jgi:hypothetical protein
MTKKNYPTFSERYHNNPMQKRITVILRGDNLKKFQDYQKKHFISESKAGEKMIEKFFENNL